MDLKEQFKKFQYIIKLYILVIEFFVIEKSDNGWENIIEYFYISLINSMTFSSINLGLIQLVGIEKLVLIKAKLLIYKKKES